MKRILLLFLIFAAIVSAQDFQAPVTTSGLQIGAGPVAIPKSGLPSWLNSDWSPVFNGVNQYASATLGANTSTSWTWAVWLKPYGQTNLTRFLNNRVSGASGSIDLYQISSSTAGCSVANATFTAFSIFPAAWGHVAVSKSGASANLYVNGVLSETKTVPEAQMLSEADLLFGKYATFGNCALSELSIWNRALSQSEILKYKGKRLKGTESGLIALYHMNEGPGNASQTLVDSVGGKNATCYNSVQWTKRNGYSAPDIRAASMALSFDGVDDYASGTNTEISTYPITIESWVRTDANLWGAANGLDDAAATSGYIILKTETGSLVAGTVYNGHTSVAMATASRGLGVWHHLALTIDNARIQKFYLNGDLVSSGTAPVFVTGIGKIIHVGHTYLNTTSPRYAKGKSAELRIWNTARTQAEIQANMYQQMTGSETGLVYYYRGNEGTGTTLNNLGSAGSAGSLTLYNSPTWTGRDIP